LCVPKELENTTQGKEIKREACEYGKEPHECQVKKD
jgi:hypothetical protein